MAQAFMQWPGAAQPSTARPMLAEQAQQDFVCWYKAPCSSVSLWILALQEKAKATYRRNGTASFPLGVPSFPVRTASRMSPLRFKA